MKRAAALSAAWTLAACATVPLSIPLHDAFPSDGWTPSPASSRPVGLGLPGGVRLAEGVRFIGGLELVAGGDSPLHGLSDLKVSGGWLHAVTDAGDLVRFRVAFDAATGTPMYVERLGLRRLTSRDGGPITDTFEGDAEGLALIADRELLVSFERDHRIWTYGPLDDPDAPTPLPSPDHPFASNAGMEGLASGQGDWRVAGEDGGVWDCDRRACRVVVAPPDIPPPPGAYRTTGLDRDPGGEGWFVVQRAYRPPLDARARVLRMDAEGRLGPALIALSLPSTVENFEGVAAETTRNGTRLYILSDDNFSARQRTLLLIFDVPGRAGAED
ncbi:esterase-like activity of phytase family protein [Brevundimonas sp.]|uniref:esterase-like activity of phytase family protein n=1 Tax=Brevundimonas sp. TaxID=1871086 RepID=UPI0035636BF1